MRSSWAASALLVAHALGGCASARFHEALAACDPAAEVEPARALGYATGHAPPSGALAGGAAINHEAAPPWVVGQSRVYPFDPSLAYWAYWTSAAIDAPVSGAPQAERAAEEVTPLVCRMSYDRTRRRALFAADPFTHVEISAVYEVPGKSPPLRVHGPRDTPSAILLDAATALEPGDRLRLALVDRDWRWGIDDPLVDLLLRYDEAGRARATSQLWRGAVIIECGHLDPDAARRAFDDALAEIDAGLRAWAPELVPRGWDFGLSAAGMTGMRAALERAASLRRQGWDAPEVRERTERLLARQLCFERAAAPEVARLAARLSRRAPVGLRRMQIEGTAYACPSGPSGAPECRLEAAVTNLERDGSSPLAFAGHVRLVLAGGREIPLTIERSVVGDRAREGAQELPAGATATVTYRLEVPLRDDVALARPVLLRDRRRKLLSQEHEVQDLALRLPAGPDAP